MTSWIASNPVVYPALEAAHITGIALMVGSLVLLEEGQLAQPARRARDRTAARPETAAGSGPAFRTAQSAPVDSARLLASAVLPTRRDRLWEIELAPPTRMAAWGVPEIQVGESVALVGFTLTGEKGEAVLRAEYLFAGGKAYGLRSSPA